MCFLNHQLIFTHVLNLAEDSEQLGGERRGGVLNDPEIKNTLCFSGIGHQRVVYL